MPSFCYLRERINVVRGSEAAVTAKKNELDG